VEDAQAQLAGLENLAAVDGDAGLNRVKEVLAVAVLNAKARIALAEDRGDEAIGLLREAVAKEDKLAYSEPADWFFPTRHLLGAVLIKAGKPADAEAVYRDDLSRHPNNGWALYGLAQSLKLQSRSADASAVQQQFDTAWKNADVTLVASAY
jgi:tetratricopeptide (TPR) repeat protein